MPKYIFYKGALVQAGVRDDAKCLQVTKRKAFVLWRKSRQVKRRGDVALVI